MSYGSFDIPLKLISINSSETHLLFFDACELQARRDAGVDDIGASPSQRLSPGNFDQATSINNFDQATSIRRLRSGARR